MAVFVAILTSLPFFFDAIENRNGYMFPDYILELIPARNFSIAVFFLIWSSCLLLIFRIYRDPMMMLVTLWAYNCVTLLRMACIGLISLNPPAGLIPLADPITNQFYGAHYITHDLFFLWSHNYRFPDFFMSEEKMGSNICTMGLHPSGIIFTGSACTLYDRRFGSSRFYVCCLPFGLVIYKKRELSAYSGKFTGLKN